MLRRCASRRRSRDVSQKTSMRKQQRVARKPTSIWHLPMATGSSVSPQVCKGLLQEDIMCCVAAPQVHGVSAASLQQRRLLSAGVSHLMLLPCLLGTNKDCPPGAMRNQDTWWPEATNSFTSLQFTHGGNLLCGEPSHGACRAELSLLPWQARQRQVGCSARIPRRVTIMRRKRRRGPRFVQSTTERFPSQMPIS